MGCKKEKTIFLRGEFQAYGKQMCDPWLECFDAFVLVAVESQDSEALDTDGKCLFGPLIVENLKEYTHGTGVIIRQEYFTGWLVFR